MPLGIEDGRRMAGERRSLAHALSMVGLASLDLEAIGTGLLDPRAEP